MQASLLVFQLSTEVINPVLLRGKLESPSCGALATFEGWVRNHNSGNSVLQLAYEAFDVLAEKEGHAILLEAKQRFAIQHALCVHRTGLLNIGDLAVYVAVTAPHRGAAFDACRYIIDQTKARVPIWKKERVQSGKDLWIAE